ncbi:MAG TPA: hypothetical protein VE779_11955 [Candidatus Angelobacter sp.]|jgi:hypothetical protein|nr:hypothetical protein [Candidatus Angelobacter sp.]
MQKKSSKRKWMAKAFGKNPGKLHRQLNVPEGEKIPESKLQEAEHSSDPTLRREAALAETGKRYAGKRRKKTA